MIRRQRRIREIPFSFDSFLDVVANVVGIIIRLILVVWVGARSYGSIQHLIQNISPTNSQTDKALSGATDPMQAILVQHRQQLALAQAKLLDQMRLLQGTQTIKQEIQGQLVSLASRRENVEHDVAKQARLATDKNAVIQTAMLSLTDLRSRQEKMMGEIQALENQPASKKVLRYRTPVSRPVNTEEYFFECAGGRVAFIDIPSLLADVRREMDDKSKALRTKWRETDVSLPVGAFRLRYIIERQRGIAEAIAPGAGPDVNAPFHYGMSEWLVEPVSKDRGETLSAALIENSEFRQRVDRLDPQQGVVTFWVYPDSFEVYRGLRDYLYDRDVVVAGRPLPEGVPISCSRRGTLSRGQ